MYGVGNWTSVPIKVTLDVSKSDNLLSSGLKSHVVSKVVEPNKVEFLMYTRREEMLRDMTFDFSYSIQEV